MREVNNEILKNPRYITKSKITRKELNKMHIPKNVTINEAKEALERSQYTTWELVGIPFNENRQRHVQVISKQALYRELVKGTHRKRR